MQTVLTTRRGRFPNIPSAPRRVECNGISIKQKRRISLNRQMIPPLRSMARITVGYVLSCVQHARASHAVLNKWKRRYTRRLYSDCLPGFFFFFYFHLTFLIEFHCTAFDILIQKLWFYVAVPKNHADILGLVTFNGIRRELQRKKCK